MRNDGYSTIPSCHFGIDGNIDVEQRGSHYSKDISQLKAKQRQGIASGFLFANFCDKPHLHLIRTQTDDGRESMDSLECVAGWILAMLGIFENLRLCTLETSFCLGADYCKRLKSQEEVFSRTKKIGRPPAYLLFVRHTTRLQTIHPRTLGGVPHTWDAQTLGLQGTSAVNRGGRKQGLP